MPRRTKKFANFLNRAAHMNKVRKIKNIPLHDALAEQQQQQDETRANKTLEDVEQNDHLFDLPETSADDGCNINISPSVSDSPADTTTIDQNAEVQTEVTPASKDYAAVEGRRIIDVRYFFKKLQEIANHGSLNCGLGCVEFIGEKRTGFHSLFTLKCLMCNDKFYVENDPPGEQLTINHCAVAGTIATGNGHSQLQEFSASLNLPIMTSKTYKACHCKLQTHWEKFLLRV
nr:uncharacterized protein LOC126054422 [Helicoverpa armigera]